MSASWEMRKRHKPCMCSLNCGLRDVFQPMCATTISICDLRKRPFFNCLKFKCFFLFQFVPFRDFLQSVHGSVAQDALAKEVLAEVPGQLLLYMQQKGIKPRPPQPLSTNQITPVIGQHASPSAPSADPPYPVATRNPPYPVSTSNPPYPT